MGLFVYLVLFLDVYNSEKLDKLFKSLLLF